MCKGRCGDEVRQLEDAKLGKHDTKGVLPWERDMIRSFITVIRLAKAKIHFPYPDFRFPWYCVLKFNFIQTRVSDELLGWGTEVGVIATSG
jgi:hypothetical protein